MDLSDSPGSPAYPSRVSGWLTQPPLGVSRVALDPLLQACRRQYPGGTTDPIIARAPAKSVTAAFPATVTSRLPQLDTFEACAAFTHVTACLFAGPPRGPFHRELRQVRYLPRRPDCYRLERQLPGGICTH